MRIIHPAIIISLAATLILIISLRAVFGGGAWGLILILPLGLLVSLTRRRKKDEPPTTRPNNRPIEPS